MKQAEGPTETKSPLLLLSMTTSTPFWTGLSVVLDGTDRLGKYSTTGNSGITWLRSCLWQSPNSYPRSFIGQKQNRLEMARVIPGASRTLVTSRYSPHCMTNQLPKPFPLAGESFVGVWATARFLGVGQHFWDLFPPLFLLPLLLQVLAETTSSGSRSGGRG